MFDLCLQAPGEKCVLMWGDDRGSVNLLWFLQPFKGLFEMPFTNQTGPVQIFMPVSVFIFMWGWVLCQDSLALKMC